MMLEFGTTTDVSIANFIIQCDCEGCKGYMYIYHPASWLFQMILVMLCLQGIWFRWL